MSDPSRFPLPKVALILFLVCLLAHGLSLGNGFILDDHLFTGSEILSRYPQWQDYFTTATSQHFSPLYYLMNSVLFQAMGQTPLPLRMINLFLFYLNALGLYVLLHAWLRRADLALLTALLFALHPLNAFILDYITCNFVLVLGLALQAGLLCLLPVVAAASKAKKGGWLLLSLLFYLLALLCSETALMMPLFILTFLKVFKSCRWRQTLSLILPFFLLALAYFLRWLTLAGSRAGLWQQILNLGLSPLSFLASVLALLAWYLKNVFVPSGIVLIHNVQPLQTGLWIWIGGGLTIMAGLVWWLNRPGKNTDIQRAGLLWFCCGLPPVGIGCVAHSRMGMVIEPHWLFFPLSGLLLAMAAVLLSLKARLPKQLWFALVGLLAGYLFLFSQLSHHHNRTEVNFHRFWHQQEPDNPIPVFELGSSYLVNRDFAPAEYYFARALNTPGVKRENVLINLAIIAYERQDLPLAKDYIRQALTGCPGIADAYNLLGLILIQEQDLDSAKQAFQKAITLQPNHDKALRNLNRLH